MYWRAATAGLLFFAILPADIEPSTGALRDEPAGRPFCERNPASCSAMLEIYDGAVRKGLYIAGGIATTANHAAKLAQLNWTLDWSRLREPWAPLPERDFSPPQDRLQFPGEPPREDPPTARGTLRDDDWGARWNGGQTAARPQPVPGPPDL